MKIRLFVEQAR